MTSRWTEADTLKLIKLYKSYEFLWNRNTQMYKNLFARNQAYQAIVQEMDVPGLTLQDVKCKIKNLRTSYYQEQRKMASFKMQNKILKPLKWFSAFKSVMGNIQPQDKATKMTESESDQSEELEEDEERVIDNSPFLEESTSNSDTYVVSIKQEFLDEMDKLSDKTMPPTICDYLEPVVPPKRPKIIAVQSRINESKKSDEGMPSQKKTKNADEFQMFANNIAQQLRKLPLKRALNLQVEVQRMIAKERIDILNKRMGVKNEDEDSG